MSVSGTAIGSEATLETATRVGAKEQEKKSKGHRQVDDRLVWAWVSWLPSLREQSSHARDDHMKGSGRTEGAVLYAPAVIPSTDVFLVCTWAFVLRSYPLKHLGVPHTRSFSDLHILCLGHLSLTLCAVIHTPHPCRRFICPTLDTR